MDEDLDGLPTDAETDDAKRSVKNAASKSSSASKPLPSDEEDSDSELARHKREEALKLAKNTPLLSFSEDSGSDVETYRDRAEPMDVDKPVVIDIRNGVVKDRDDAGDNRGYSRKAFSPKAESSRRSAYSRDTRKRSPVRHRSRRSPEDRRRRRSRSRTPERKHSGSSRSRHRARTSRSPSESRNRRRRTVSSDDDSDDDRGRRQRRRSRTSRSPSERRSRHRRTESPDDDSDGRGRRRDRDDRGRGRGRAPDFDRRDRPNGERQDEKYWQRVRADRAKIAASGIARVWNLSPTRSEREEIDEEMRQAEKRMAAEREKLERVERKRQKARQKEQQSKDKAKDASAVVMEAVSSVSSSSDEEDEKKRKKRKKEKKKKSRKDKDKKKSRKHKKRRHYSDSDDSDDRKSRKKKKRSRRRDSSSSEDSDSASDVSTAEKDVKHSINAEARPKILGPEPPPAPSTVAPPAEDDDRMIGPVIPEHLLQADEKEEWDYHNDASINKDMLRGEAAAMAAYVAQGKRIPRRGEIGLSSTEISTFEQAGYVMSGTRHKAMEATRLRKENQILTAEEKRLLSGFTQEQRRQKEDTVLLQMRSLVDSKKSRN